MLLNEREERHNTVLQAAKLIMSAARTAPKARGVDLIEIAVVEGDDLKRLSDATIQMYERTGRPVYQRDAANILQGEAVLLIGTRRQVMGLNCAHCGYATCGEKPENVSCAINTTDVGIAIGSACATAADLRIDTRVLFSAGMGAMLADFLPGCTDVFAIALSASSKNPFFDRK